VRTESVLLLSSLNFAINRAEEEKKKRRYVNTPNGRVHLEGGAVSRKRWMEMLNEADLWKQSTRRRKKFGESRPRERAIKLLQDGRQHYLPPDDWRRSGALPHGDCQ
jgi:hypothetical protein